MRPTEPDTNPDTNTINREGHTLTTTAETTTAIERNAPATIDTPAGTIVKVVTTRRSIYHADAEGSLAIVKGEGTVLPGTLNVHWLRSGGPYRDGAYYADRFDVFEFQVGDRVKIVGDAPIGERGWEGVIETFETGNIDDVKVHVEAGDYHFTYRFEHIERIIDAEILEDLEQDFEEDSEDDYDYEDDYDPFEDLYGDEEDEEDEDASVKIGFDGGSIVVISQVDMADPAWLGFRAIVQDAQHLAGMVLLKPIGERPDGYGEGVFYWETEQVRQFDPATDLTVGEVVEIQRQDGSGLAKQWNGFQARVTARPNYDHSISLGSAWLTPLTERPDGFRFSQFNWDVVDLRPVGQAIKPEPEPEPEPESEPKFKVGDILTTVRPNNQWDGVRVKVLQPSAQNGGWLYVSPIDDRPDRWGKANFYWDPSLARPFDPATDFKVGDVVEAFGDAEGVVTKLHISFGGNIEVAWTKGFAIAGDTLGTQRDNLTLVGHQEPVEPIREDFTFEAGQEIASMDVLDELPRGTVLVIPGYTWAPIICSFDYDKDPRSFLRFNVFADDSDFRGLSYSETGRVRQAIEEGEPVIIVYVPSDED